MAITAALTLLDIPWLRQAARPVGTVGIPHAIASRLLAGGLVERRTGSESLKITPRGQLALSRLG